MLYLCNPKSPEGFLIEKTANLLDGKKKENKKLKKNEERLCSVYK